MSASPHESLAIRIHQLRYRWPGRPEPVIAIDRWEVERGQQVFLHGPSGSGKSTLLNLLAGVLLAESGELEVLDHVLADMSARARDRFRARHVGFVFQQFNLIPYLTAGENIRLAARFARTPAERVTRDVLVELLQQLALPAEVLDRRTGELSVGQQQRIAVARALVNRPEVILADEPTSALDQDARYAFIDVLLRSVRASGAAVVFVSHDRSLAQHFQRHVSLSSLNRAMGADGWPDGQAERRFGDSGPLQRETLT